MIVPNSIPNWIKIIDNINKNNAEFPLTINPETLSIEGNLFFNNNNYKIIIKNFKNNLLLELNKFDNEVLKLLENAFQEEVAIVYTLKDNKNKNIFLEWYFSISDEIVISEIKKIIPFINVLYVIPKYEKYL